MTALALPIAITGVSAFRSVFIEHQGIGKKWLALGQGDFIHHMALPLALACNDLHGSQSPASVMHCVWCRTRPT